MNGNEFKKGDRLLKRKEFLRLSRDGKRISNRHFIIRHLSNDVARSRMGIIVTKKVGNAVLRNRLKRLIRESFRVNRQHLGTQLDLVIIAKKSAAGLTSNQVFTQMAQLFGQLPGKGDV